MSIKSILFTALIVVGVMFAVNKVPALKGFVGA